MPVSQGKHSRACGLHGELWAEGEMGTPPHAHSRRHPSSPWEQLPGAWKHKKAKWRGLDELSPAGWTQVSESRGFSEAQACFWQSWTRPGHLVPVSS